MKKLFTAVILGIALAGVSLAQTSSGKAEEIKMAVVEFSSGANDSEMPLESRRQLQTSLAAALARSIKFDIADIRWTRTESQEGLANLNNGSSTAAAVKLGKLLSVRYVLTGTVSEYTPKDAEGFSHVILKTRLINVATGKVVHTSETSARSTGAMRTNGAAEIQSKLIKPAVENLTAKLFELKL